MRIGDGVGRLVGKLIAIGEAGAIDVAGRLAPFEVPRGCCLRTVGLVIGLTTGELLVTETRTGPPLVLPDFALLVTPVTRSTVARRFTGGRPFITGVCGSTTLPCLALPSVACACACACAAWAFCWSWNWRADSPWECVWNCCIWCWSCCCCAACAC